MKKLPLTLCVIALALAACSSKEESVKTPLIRTEGERVVLTEPDKADFLTLAVVEPDKGGLLHLPGRLVWNEEKTVRIFPQLGGRVQHIAVDVGQRVKAGQALATLLSPDYGQAEADARSADAGLKVAEKALARSRDLRDAGVIAEKDWQQAEADAARAKAEADRARRRLNGLGGDSEGSYVLKSPLAGVVVERNLNPGMEFRPDQSGAALFVVTDPTSLWLQLDAAEDDLSYLKTGEAVDIEVKQFPGEKFKGVIRHIADFVDPQSRTIKVRCEAPNPDRRLKGEMFAQISVELPANGRLTVPSQAVLLQGAKRYVMVEAGKGEFVRREIVAGVEREGRVEIVSGLKAGERVVTAGNLHLAKYIKDAKAASK